MIREEVAGLEDQHLKHECYRDRVEPVLPLAEGRRRRSGAAAAAGAGGRAVLATGVCTLWTPWWCAPTSTLPRHVGPAPLGDDETVEGVDETLGRSQSRFTTKPHLRAEGGGKPIAAVLTAGERHKQFAIYAPKDKGIVPVSHHDLRHGTQIEQPPNIQVAYLRDPSDPL